MFIGKRKKAQFILFVSKHKTFVRRLLDIHNVQKMSEKRLVLIGKWKKAIIHLPIKHNSPLPPNNFLTSFF